MNIKEELIESRLNAERVVKEIARQILDTPGRPIQSDAIYRIIADLPNYARRLEKVASELAVVEIRYQHIKERE